MAAEQTSTPASNRMMNFIISSFSISDHRCVAASENAPLIVVVVELGALDPAAVSGSREGLGREQHPERRSDEIKPQRGPDLRGKRRAEGPRRIHAHTRDRRLESRSEERRVGK